MKVILSGYNVDTEVLKQLKEGTHDGSDNVTPEVISAAYAQISRDPKAVNELRDKSREKIKAARRSNRNIVFKMSHHSVAEHATLNYDIIGISRLAIEALEAHRLCSFTEKSQRYITLDGDFVMPNEFTSDEKNLFTELTKEQNNFYHQLLPKLMKYQFETNPDLVEIADEKQVQGVSDKNNREKNTLEGWAKEDARYVLNLATEGQLGFTANARNLEHVIRDFKYHHLAEVREIGEKLYQEAKEVVPSLIIMADEGAFKETQGTSLQEDFLKNGRKDMVEATSLLIEKVSDLFNYDDPLLEDFDEISMEPVPKGYVDRLIISALIANNSSLSIEEADLLYSHIDDDTKVAYLKDGLQNLGKFDSMPREFEMADLTFEVVMSSSCYAQMKRHRMCTLLPGEYNTDLGVTIPESIKAVGKETNFRNIIDQTEQFVDFINENHPETPELSDYCLTNAHQRRVIVKTNIRELYHFSRMREDGHAQWDIRYKANKMINLAKEVAPLTTMFMGGKDQFDRVREEIYKK
jgi:flavin-dependent thymidylate synthase